MSEETLFETAQPLVTFLSLYGVNWKSERRTGWRMLKLSQLIIFLTLISVANRIEHEDTTNVKLPLRVNLFSFLFCSFRWKPFNHLFDLLRTCNMPNTILPEFNKIRRFSRLSFCVSTTVLGMAFLIWGSSYVQHFLEVDASISFILEVIFASFLTLTYISFALRLALVLPAVCALVCLIAYYIDLRFEKSIEELNRCKSPLRRAKMTTKLIQQFDHFFRLAIAANTIGSILMFALKISALFIFFERCFALVNDFKNWKGQDDEDLGLNMLDMFSVPYPWVITWLVYLKVAPSVNQMPLKMCSALIKSVMEQDSWLPHDPILRPFLLRVRLDHLAHLTHLTFHQSLLTILDEPLDDEGLFRFFVDMIDNFNMVYSVKERIN